MFLKIDPRATFSVLSEPISTVDVTRGKGSWPFLQALLFKLGK